jgi:hypothetical protein
MLQRSLSGISQEALFPIRNHCMVFLNHHIHEINDAQAMHHPITRTAITV